jgi:hypothetical protein
MIAEAIESAAEKNLVCSACPSGFFPAIIACRLIKGQTLSEVSKFERAQGAILAIVEKPNLVDNEWGVISDCFWELRTEDVVRAALASTKVMAFVLSKIKEGISDNMKGCEILERLISLEKGRDARDVACLLQAKLGIEFLFNI